MVTCVALTHYVHAALSYLIDTLCNEMCNNSARKKAMNVTNTGSTNMRVAIRCNKALRA